MDLEAAWAKDSFHGHMKSFELSNVLDFVQCGQINDVWRDTEDSQTFEIESLCGTTTFSYTDHTAQGDISLQFALVLLFIMIVIR